ncbi:sperm microtubule associated protein 2-like [Macrotis lagotis]|uniref:sperm microtubule associated protein 2-like n=1 Tax=Macrotis lagotis TaxID=92651 RepID=UPI003D69CF5B
MRQHQHAEPGPAGPVCSGPASLRPRGEPSLAPGAGAVGLARRRSAEGPLGNLTTAAPRRAPAGARAPAQAASSAPGRKTCGRLCRARQRPGRPGPLGMHGRACHPVESCVSCTPEGSACYYTESDTRNFVKELSRPKMIWRLPDRKLVWGNQDPIKPLPLSALDAKLTRRFDRLAEPKKVSILHVPNRPEYHNSWGRGSTIWKLPTKSFFNYPSSRIEALAEPKRVWNNYSHCRPYSSLEWQVKDPSLIPEASVRIVQLSMAKATHPDFVAPKQVETKISSAALHARPSSRVISLSEPKVKRDTLYFERGENDLPIRPVSIAAMSAKPSPRTQFLAKAKTVHDDYLPMRPVQQPVSRSALKYVPSPRIEVLATPNPRTPLIVNSSNLDVFKVKDAAKVAICSPRLAKLAEPIRR